MHNDAIRLLEYAQHKTDCRAGSRADRQPQDAFGAPCSCGLHELYNRVYRSARTTPIPAAADTGRRRNPWEFSTVERGKDWGDPMRFACDDAKTGDQLDLVIQRGGNGDWYVSVVPKGQKALRCVRISTSGGASFSTPGLTAAICDAYDALYSAHHAARVLPTVGSEADHA